MGEAFLLNMDALVTKDYLDAKFAEQDARIEARMDVRFAEVDARLTEMDARMDIRFAEQEGRIDTRFAEMDGKFRLLTWMLAAVIASTVIPAMHKLLA